MVVFEDSVKIRFHAHRCDRHWYEREGVFESLEQLDALRESATLARLVCVNCDRPRGIQRREECPIDSALNQS